MQRQSLSGAWQFRQSGTSDWLPATAPGGVHTDLLALGRIPDPFVGDNELKVMWVAENDWEYHRVFTVDAGLLGQKHVFLVCDGLDTLADVYVNGAYLGHANNMFRRWEWDVKALLHRGENEIRICFSSPLRFIAGKQAQLPLTGGGDIPGGPHLRKAPCQWGWDWGPKLPPIGIWKDIRLEGFAVRLTDDVHVQQRIEGGAAVITAHIHAQAPYTLTGPEIMASLTVTAPTGETFTAEEKLLWLWENEPHFADPAITIPQPQLWWPNGMGAQPLYRMEVALHSNGALLDRRRFQIGLRTITLRQEPDAWGREFTFYVNGVRLFAKGANWIPADSLPTRLTQKTLEGLIQSAAAAHMNMLRVWGGGYYPEDMFYDLCDRYGLLVWQDFMFACGIYPADAGFFANVRAEATENVRRLRHHASLALWCGNNEMEQGWCEWGWDQPEDPVNQRLKAGYDRMFHQVLPALLAQEDPDRPYWPSSASANTPFQGANNQVQGDCHYWEVWHGRKPFTAYRSQFPRFMSEFGFQALPPLPTIAAFAEPADWNMTSYIMEHHQRSPAGNGLMMTQMAASFRMPKDFSALVYLSLVLQAEGIRYGVEHWRRSRDRVSGTLIWQLNDCWPVASWSSMDYFGRWKALHYAAKRFYAPLLLSVADEGTRMHVHLTNDHLQPAAGVLRWRLESLAGQVVQQDEQAVQVPALADVLAASLDFTAQITSLRPPANQRQMLFVCEWWEGNERRACSVTPFVPNKHLALSDPGLQVTARAAGSLLQIEVSAHSLARFVEVAIAGADTIFSDNYFDLPTNTTTAITCPLPAEWTPDQQNRILVRSLYDSFA